MLDEERIRPIGLNTGYLSSFPEEVYDLSPSSHVVKLVTAVCGDGGIGSLRKASFLDRLQSSIETTSNYDIDQFFGNTMRFPRLQSEVYQNSPQSDLLSATDWDEVKTKDAVYRGRVVRFMRSFSYGGTLEGIRLAAMSACDSDCLIFPVSLYYGDLGIVDGAATSEVIGYLSATNADYREVIVVPLVAAVDAEMRRLVVLATDRVKPQDVVITVASPSEFVAMFPSDYWGVVFSADAVRVVQDVGASELVLLFGASTSTPSQSFQLPTSTLITAMSFETTASCHAGTFYVEFWDGSVLVDGWSPSVEITGAWGFISIPEGAGTHVINLEVPYVLAANTTGVFRLQNVAWGAFSTLAYSEVNPYADGALYDDMLTEMAGDDLKFSIYGRLVEYASPPSMSYYSEVAQPSAPVASSEYFFVKRFVTGRSDWPIGVDNSKGFWIQQNVDVESPTQAFGQHQEEIFDNTLQVGQVFSSTNHKGDYNGEHAKWFSHLQDPAAREIVSPEQALRRHFTKRVSASYYGGRNG
jgi:hypothetical protein